VLKILAPILIQPDDAGALPTRYAVTSPDAKGGEYIEPDGFQEAGLNLFHGIVTDEVSFSRVLRIHSDKVIFLAVARQNGDLPSIQSDERCICSPS